MSSSWLSGLSWSRTVFSLDNDTLTSISSIFTMSFSFCSGVDTHISHQSRFICGTQNRLLPEWYDGWTFPWWWYWWRTVWTDEHGSFRHLETGSKDEPDWWRSAITFLITWMISFDIPMMSHKEAVCLRWVFKNIHRCGSNSLWCSQLTYQKLPQPWHHHPGFPKLFKSTLIQVYVNFWLWR